MSEAPGIVWFRRDLRLGDLPTLTAARGGSGGRALALFVLDPALLRPAGRARIAALRSALTALDESLGGRLCVVAGDPVAEVPRVAAAIGAGAVHVGEDLGPYGSRRDEAVEEALAADGRGLERTGSPYAVTPGRVLNGSGEPYKVFTPFRRAWYEHGWHSPAETGADTLDWLDPDEVGGRVDPGVELQAGPEGVDLPEISEAAARRRWAEFLDDGLGAYEGDRDRPDRDATSRMSAHLKFGTIHPRTMLADLAALGSSDSLDADLREARDTFASELAWREFYADVLHHRPETARENVDRRYGRLEWDSGPAIDEAVEAWKAGRTGVPIVDAGMRQLLAEGWMHNRLRMIVASYLTKDLHVDWRVGAAHFMRHLVDGDLASNQHGWQWTAGTGTDAAPYFRVFNPVTQGKRFDPDGDYVRRWVPELADIAGAKVHTPRDGGYGDYPAPLVDHAEERRVAIARYEAARER